MISGFGAGRQQSSLPSLSFGGTTPGRARCDMLVLGIEGSANKVGVGIVSQDGVIHANPRHT